MRRQRSTPGRRRFTGTGILVVAVAATVVALLYPVWSYTQRPAATDASTGTVSAQNAQNAQGAQGAGSTPGAKAPKTVPTRFGPLSALDRTFLDTVRTAELWELPAGRQAEKKGTTAAVRTAGQHVTSGNTFLGSRVTDVDRQLGLTPPATANAQQKAWLRALGAATGRDYDRTFVNTLRLADGKILPVVAEVRAATANSLVRALADDAEVTVLDHIRVLEATGDVDFAALARGLADDGASATPGTSSPGPKTASGSGASSSASPAATSPKPSASYALPPAESSPPPPAKDGSGTGSTSQQQADDRTTDRSGADTGQDTTLAR